jgi:hypothetical protein
LPAQEVILRSEPDRTRPPGRWIEAKPESTGRVRLLGSDDFPLDAKREAAHDLTTAACDQALSIAISDPLPLDRMAEAHDRVDAGARQRVLLEIPG